MKRFFLFAFATIIVFSLTFCKNKENGKERPNIILIMADDMGYSDIGCYGGEIQTPNIDHLAENGICFTQFYNTARCCPTRASLMTGCYPHQTGIGHMTNTPADFTQHDLNIPGYRGFLNKNCVTIAEVLKKAGYATLMTGKWHLGISSKEKWPLQRGFDKYYGIIPGACNYFNPVPPRGLTLGNDTVMPEGDDYYTTDAFTDYAIQFITESQHKNKQPFFLYLAYNAPHWPLNAPQEDIDKYKGKYSEGWQKLRLERYERMKKMGLIDPDWKLTNQDSRDWNLLSDEKKEEMDLRMAIYAAQVDRMDQNIGKLIDFLKVQNLLENTVIFFLIDNGACAEGGELGGGPADILETKQGYFLSYGRAWANASNTPFRKYKHWVHEGGIATPLIVHWPEGIPQKDHGTFIREYGFLPDIMATCIDISKTVYPEKYNENKIIPMSGKSLLPVIQGQRKPIHVEPIFWEHEGNKAVRLGKYKLVQDWDKNSENNWELYDLENDRTEMNDLAKEIPEKTQEMIKMYEEWAEQNSNLMPWNTILNYTKKEKTINLTEQKVLLKSKIQD